MSGALVEYLAMATLVKRIPLNQWFPTFFMQRHQAHEAHFRIP